MALYAHIGPELYGVWVRRIARAEPASISATRLPVIDGDDVATFLDAAGLGQGGTFAVVADDN